MTVMSSWDICEPTRMFGPFVLLFSVWQCIIFACYFWKFKSRSLLFQPTFFLQQFRGGDGIFLHVIFCKFKGFILLFQPTFVMLLFYSSLRGIFPGTRGHVAPGD